MVMRETFCSHRLQISQQRMVRAGFFGVTNLRERNVHGQTPIYIPQRSRDKGHENESRGNQLARGTVGRVGLVDGLRESLLCAAVLIRSVGSTPEPDAWQACMTQQVGRTSRRVLSLGIGFRHRLLMRAIKPGRYETSG